MATIGGRFFAGFGAILFLATSSALTIAVVVTLVQQHKKPSDGGTTTNSATAAKNTPAPTSPITQPSIPAGYTQLTASTNLTGVKMENFTPSSTPLTKLQVQDLKVGSGQTVQAGDTVTADYVGALVSNGTIFDASANHGGPQTFPLSGVIAGWSQGIPGMKVGGTRRLLIPANLAYGSQAQSGIPANSDLVFDVTIVKIGQ